MLVTLFKTILNVLFRNANWIFSIAFVIFYTKLELSAKLNITIFKGCRMKKLLIVAVVIAILAPFCTIEIKKQLYEKKVENYLIENRSYQKEEIESIKAKWHFAGLPSYWVNVIFSDEPNVVYIYFAHNSKVRQAEYYTIDGTTLSAEQLKHFKPYE